MKRAELSITVPVRAPLETVWRVVTDWERQGDWMLGTAVRVTSGDGHSLGSSLAAWTGAGPIGFIDTMEIIEWQPPYRCVVRHTGQFVRGTGSFELVPRDGVVEVVWGEQLDLPFGVVGRWGWPVVRPGFAAGVKLSLRRLARVCESRAA